MSPDLDTRHALVSDEYEKPISFAHFFHTLHLYRNVIGFTAAAVFIAYAIVALAAYLRAPKERITSQSFRLSFKGAEEGLYPSGTKFSGSDIVAAPILTRVFQQNELARFTSPDDFSRSLVVLESNRAYETLAADYTARLEQKNLSPVDRERIEREFEAKRAAIAKNDYALSWMRSERTRRIPETLVRKTLVDVLDTWSRVMSNEQRVLEYRLAILSPEVVNPGALEQGDSIVAIQILRSKLARILENIDQLARVPGAEMIRTREGNLSLTEIRLRLEDIVRYHLDPLVGLALSRASGLVKDPASTTAFLESQLRYDERQLRIHQQNAENIRQALAVYAMERPALAQSGEHPQPSRSAPQTRETGGAEAGLTTQLSDTFLDRLVTLTTQSGDITYRQRLVDEYKAAASQIAPAEEAVAYDRSVLEAIRNPASGGGTATAEAVREQIEQTRNEVRGYVRKVNEIHGLVSRVLNPTAQLVSSAGPATTRTQRGVDTMRLLLGAPLVLLIAIPLTIVACLIHNRVREEDSADAAHDEQSRADV